MLPPGNVRGVFALLVLALAGVSASGQDGAAAAEAPELAWADGEAAFDWVQGWVRSEKGVPDDAELPDRPVTGLFGVYVTLREDGKVLGRGQALRSDVAKAIDVPGPMVQVAPLLAAATRQALDDLRDKQMKRAVELNIADPDLFKAALMATRQRAQVDVQLGHSLESIVLPLDAKDDAVFATFAPGFHGLRLAGPLTGKADYAWPATELARNTSPSQLFLRLLDQQGYAADELALVAKADGPALQRFEVIHVVRPRQAQPRRTLIRGNLILPRQNIDGRTLAGLSERTARYLDQLIYTDSNTGQMGVRGTYKPSLERYSPEWSDLREAALVCYALNRHARVTLDAGGGGETTRARSQRVLRLIEMLAPSAIPQGKPPKHLSAAFLLLSLCESPVRLKPQQLVLRDRLGQALVELWHPEGGGYRVQADSDTRLSRASASVITYALAAWHQQTRSQTLAEPVWSVLDELIEINADDPRVIDLLWVSHAIDKAGPALAQAQDKPDQAAKTLAEWNEARADYLDLLSEQQLRGKPVLGPNDVAGGFILKQAPPGSPPNPTWQSAMPLAYICIGMRNDSIVPTDKQFGPLLTAGLGARFIGQLMVSESSAYYIREPDAALGGVRATLWDNTLYPDCSAMALIALAELQQTISVLQAKQDE